MLIDWKLRSKHEDDEGVLCAFDRVEWRTVNAAGEIGALCDYDDENAYGSPLRGEQLIVRCSVAEAAEFAVGNTYRVGFG